MPHQFASLQTEFQKIKEHLEHELASIRTGRALPSMIEHVPVKAYGSVMKLLELASITAPDPKTLTVQPWDKTVMKDIEKALQEANTGCGIAVDSEVIRLTVPMLTRETRDDMKKRVEKAVEEARVRLRGVRDTIRHAITDQERKKEITEDDRYQQFESLDKQIKAHQDELGAIGEKKSKELNF